MVDLLHEAVRRENGECLVSSTRLKNGAVFVSVSGDVDLSTAPMLERALLTAIAEGATTIAVDMSECCFVDSAGIHALLQAQAELKRTGGRLSLISPARAVRRALEVSRLERAFSVHDSRVQALGIVIAGSAG